MKSSLRALRSIPIAVPITLVVGLLLWVCGAFTLVSSMGGYSTWMKIAVLAAVCILQLISPRRPGVALAVLVVLLIADLPSGGSLPLWIAASDLVFAGVVSGTNRLRRAVVVGSVAVTVAGAAVVALLVDARTGILAGLVGVALLLSPLGYAQSVLASRRAAAAERAAAAAERATALADERRRVSRELHDTVAGHVSAIAILAEAAREMPDPQPAVTSMRTNSLAALTELREMIDLLATDDDETTTARWGSLAPLITAAEAVGSAVHVHGDTDGMPSRVEAVLTRIVGEAVSNATRHAPGHDITVTVDRTDDVLVAVIANTVEPGGGTTETGVGGYGVRNMAVRAESIGGSATAGPVDGRWEVNVRLPMGRA